MNPSRKINKNTEERQCIKCINTKEYNRHHNDGIDSGDKDMYLYVFILEVLKSVCLPTCDSTCGRFPLSNVFNVNGPLERIVECSPSRCTMYLLHSKK